MKIKYEDKSIYDGWCAEYDTDTGEVTLRDHWAVNRLSEDRKEKLIEEINLNFKIK